MAVMMADFILLRGDRSLGAFRWGLDRKQQLLDIETSK